MSHEHFKKSNREDILKMLELKKQGLSSAEIGKQMHKDHSSILYWFRKIGPNNIFVDNFEPRCAIINLEICKKPELKIDLNNCCKVCKKKKDKKWKQTDYCGLMCWHEENKKPQQNLYW
jgi:hypothetical protein